MKVSFEGKTVIVTGAARGVGRVLVRAFADAGASGIVAVDRDEPGLRETCGPIGSHVVPVVADIRHVEDVQRIVDTAVERFGGLDVCVNNAAVAPKMALLDYDPDVWDTVYAVNTRGTFLMTQAAARAMVAGNRAGRIVNFSSGSAK